MALLTELFLGFGRIVASQLKGASNAVLVNLRFLEEFGDEETGSGSSDEPMYGALGLYGRPRPPKTAADATGTDPEGETEVLALQIDDRAYPVTYRDLRLSSVVNPDEGEIGLVQYGGGFISLKFNTDENGTNVMIYAPRLDSGGTPTKASAISIDSTDGNQHICLMHEKGQSITLTKDEQVVIANVAGDAYLAVGGTDGIVLNAEKCAVNAAVMLGDKDAALGEAVMLSVALLTWIGEVNAALTALASHTHPAGALLDSLALPCTGATATPVGISAPTATPAPATKVKAI